MPESRIAHSVVLVHGAAHGAWCWERLVPLLEARGFSVDAIDLPGLGADPTPAREVTFESYVARVVRALRACPEPAILLGHSMGGGPISQAAEAVPEQVAGLIYLAAVLPQDGEALGMMVELSARFPGPSASDALRQSSIEGALDFAPELAAQAFYANCDAQTAERAVARLRPQAMRPLQGQPMSLTEQRWGRLPKTYVQCTEDRALPPALQRWLCERAAGVRVLERPWDHSPFLSDPQGLCSLIEAEARAWAR